MECLAFNNFFFVYVSLLVQCCHLSVAAVSEQVQSLQNSFISSELTQYLGKLGKFLLLIYCVVTSGLCEDCFFTCFFDTKKPDFLY